MDSSSSSAGTSAFPSDENRSFNAGGIPSIFSLTAAVSTLYQYYLDKATPLVLLRWASFGVLVFIYVIRVVLLEGFYIVSYGLGIYMLNLFIAFLSPQVDPETQQLLDSDVPALPTRSSDEFRPFVRRLLEFKFCVLFFHHAWSRFLAKLA
ncbi:Protein RER1B [Platanthera guangdongensis]|uniref:Protein RER1B n=1 Tax=Platanthera guangdongensis TaxID=2320717 RepID=A0ABR2MMB2_9ASPA